MHALAHSVQGPYLDHGDKRHDSLHVFLQFRQGSQLTGDHFVVWETTLVTLNSYLDDKKQTKK